MFYGIENLFYNLINRSRGILFYLIKNLCIEFWILRKNVFPVFLILESDVRYVSKRFWFKKKDFLRKISDFSSKNSKFSYKISKNFQKIYFKFWIFQQKIFPVFLILESDVRFISSRFWFKIKDFVCKISVFSWKYYY